MTETSRHVTPETIIGLLADTEPYLSCDDCFDQLDQYIERLAADPRYDNAAMRTHLAGCGACAQEAETLHELLAQDAARPPRR